MSDRVDTFVSVIAPMRDDADILAGFVEETVSMLETSFTNYELVLVDDGSEDDTLGVARRLLREHDCIRLLPLSRRFGQEIAISAGLDSVIGDYTVVMLVEGDPAELVPEMVARAMDGAGVVYGVRRARAGDPWWLRTGARLFYGAANRLLGLGIRADSTHFRVLSRQALNALIKVRDRRRYLRTLSSFVGYPTEEIVYEPRPRRNPPRRKGPVQALALAINIIVANTTRPLRLVSWLGLLMAGFNLAYIGYIVIVYLLKDDVVEGWATQSLQLAVGFFFVALVLAVLSEYVGRLLTEVQDRPLYYTQAEEVSSVLIADERRPNVVAESTESR
ncbi:MAG: glycosyltransferase family 2 protein [Gemmatimonadota bacterium]|nr:glycosyltransferase family 2 protein [Gemmatimonadota bacterium]